MSKQIKTNLLFILASFFMVTFVVTGCNNGKTDKATEEKTPVTPAKKDSMDSGHVAPGNDIKPVTP